ncbi:hypothetical protein [Botrimarina hoheduenensis]|uniref:Uncharacterized protein n=1 Tax=Botrimarina hoheduenensis TaxID=2528000 RepID=A0A5C5VV81_9BACT|nr:hypothetical protein [Botrimarina hoheduenensis]TWT41442.1 hypothetical protein Pla111_31570 [Botrimarina hoheduenensis]
MLTPQQVIDRYYLEHRCMLLEIGAFLDRYNAATEAAGHHADNTHKLDLLREAFQQLQGPAPSEGHAASLLQLFAKV